MKQKTILMIAAVVLVLAVVLATVALNPRHAGPAEEREAIFKAMKERSRDADRRLEEAETQVEMNFASGNVLQATEPFLAVAAEYRLRRLETVEERTALLQQLIDLTDSLRRMYDASLEGAGSIEPMLRRLRGDSLIRRQIRIWLQPDDAYRRWVRLEGAKLELDGSTIQLNNGVGKFTAERYDEQTELEVTLDPDFCFTHNGNAYAIVTEDVEKSLTSDFLRLHLCRLSEPGAMTSGGILRPVLPLDEIYLSRIEVKGSKLSLTGRKTHGGGECILEIAIPE